MSSAADRRHLPPAGLNGWIGALANWFLAGLPRDHHEAAMTEVVDEMAPAMRDAGGAWTVSYLRLSFAADSPGV